MDLGFDAEQLLNMMAYLMGDNVSLGKFTRSAEAGSQLIEEAKIEVDLFVLRTIKRSDCVARQATCRRISVSEQYQSGVAVCNVRDARQVTVPSALDIIQNKRDELHFGFFAFVELPVGCGSRGSRRCTSKQHEKVAMKQEAENPQYQNSAAAKPPIAESAEAAAIVPAIFYIAADAARCPPHPPSVAERSTRELWALYKT